MDMKAFMFNIDAFTEYAKHDYITPGMRWSPRDGFDPFMVVMHVSGGTVDMVIRKPNVIQYKQHYSEDRYELLLADPIRRQLSISDVPDGVQESLVVLHTQEPALDIDSVYAPHRPLTLHDLYDSYLGYYKSNFLSFPAVEWLSQAFAKTHGVCPVRNWFFVLVSPADYEVLLGEKLSPRITNRVDYVPTNYAIDA